MKIKLFILLFCLGVIGFYFYRTFAYRGIDRVSAFGDFNVVWDGVLDGSPIFVVSNMLPGDTETKSITVINSASVARSIVIRGIERSSSSIFPSVLDFSISKSGTDIYGGSTGIKSLSDFFMATATPSGIPLATLGSGQSVTYDLTVAFPAPSGNEFQGKSVVFDLIISVAMDVPAECRHITFLAKPIYGTQKSEVINGTDGNDLIFALEGHDVVNGHKGDDCIVGGDGRDNLKGHEGADVIIGGDGDDTLIGNDGDDRLYGESGNDHLKGDNGDDVLVGAGGDDSLYGGNGNDTIDAGDGKDSIKGDNGNDTVNAGSGVDSLDGGNGDDTLSGGDGDDYISGGTGLDRLDGEGGYDLTNGGPDNDHCRGEIKKFCEKFF